MTRQPSVTVQVGDPASPAVRKLLEQLDRYLDALYPPESNHLLSVESLRKPNVVFLTARVDDQVVGCGAFVNQVGDYGEIKRMFVLPEFRGLKIGHHLLEQLETLARASGLKVARLEIGVSQPEAMQLYQRAGYQRRGPFGSYAEDPLSIFVEKALP
jgi:putative acetyltransferase